MQSLLAPAAGGFFAALACTFVLGMGLALVAVRRNGLMRVVNTRSWDGRFVRGQAKAAVAATGAAAGVAAALEGYSMGGVQGAAAGLTGASPILFLAVKDLLTASPTPIGKPPLPEGSAPGHSVQGVGPNRAARRAAASGSTR